MAPASRNVYPFVGVEQVNKLGIVHVEEAVTGGMKGAVQTQRRARTHSPAPSTKTHPFGTTAAGALKGKKELSRAMGRGSG